MKISRPLLQHSLLLVHGLVVGARKRGWTIEPYAKSGDGCRPGVAIAIDEHRYPIEITEGTEAVPFSHKDIEDWRKRPHWSQEDRGDKQPPPHFRRQEPTGRLRLHIPNRYAGGRATWTDGARSLNGHLDHVPQTLRQRALK